ncbi:DODA-type extradiol aromatic ring-opening family dioxygenase [Aspergillus saccharolyticus JOP 1030-1]|uniref:Extradiol ring-cleavage dioxygenase, class III enzyme, subunit B n=1 Tax=Aspergillus saccharolyticus JOP 1030-1 TaxID=1450539 RepID=A0A318ZER3_9EURO|nr:Extradiol ring-cleavage dioxygenase, class III enzyme, subunit B [Aspergillus saccharolyticus JOP 1030-1]PYH45909.1 Extradiol ring-cleavage dioxygenase, class III enzyme, subunit B [Aspergillus saccharolyticus JOP 1030-1]
MPSPTPLPTYFIGHGGVSILFKPGYGPVQHDLRQIGREIHQLRPEAIVVVSGHHQSETPGSVEVNLKEPTKVWHDLGPSWRTTFPHVFEYGYPHRSSRALGDQVLQHLRDHGIGAEGVERDLDHGVWVPFKLMFPEGSPEELIDVPILQISSFAGEDYAAHVELGRVLARLPGRILVIGSGMLCHNLRATRESTDLTVVKAIESAALQILETSPQTTRGLTEGFLQLPQRADWPLAHPTVEHVLPLYVTLGAGKEIQSAEGKEGLEEKEVELWNRDRYIVGQSYLSFRLGRVST